MLAQDPTTWPRRNKPGSSPPVLDALQAHGSPRLVELFSVVALRDRGQAVLDAAPSWSQHELRGSPGFPSYSGH